MCLHPASGAQVVREDKLKRSLDSGAVRQGSHRREAAMLDALGNAGSPQSLGVLVGAVTEGHSTLAVQHSAVRALRKFQCEEVHLCVYAFPGVCMCTNVTQVTYHSHLIYVHMYLYMYVLMVMNVYTSANTPPVPRSQSAGVLHNLAATEDLHPTLREAAAHLYHRHSRADREAAEQLLYRLVGSIFNTITPDTLTSQESLKYSSYARKLCRVTIYHSPFSAAPICRCITSVAEPLTAPLLHTM